MVLVIEQADLIFGPDARVLGLDAANSLCDSLGL